MSRPYDGIVPRQPSAPAPDSSRRPPRKLPTMPNSIGRTDRSQRAPQASDSAHKNDDAADLRQLQILFHQLIVKVARRRLRQFYEQQSRTLSTVAEWRKLVDEVETTLRDQDSRLNSSLQRRSYTDVSKAQASMRVLWELLKLISIVHFWYIVALHLWDDVTKGEDAAEFGFIDDVRDSFTNAWYVVLFAPAGATIALNLIAMNWNHQFWLLATALFCNFFISLARGTFLIVLASHIITNGSSYVTPLVMYNCESLFSIAELIVTILLLRRWRKSQGVQLVNPSSEEFPKSAASVNDMLRQRTSRSQY